MPKILITGGAGFIGSHLVDAFIKRGYKVVVVDNLSTGRKKNFDPKAKFYKMDIQDKKLSGIFRREKFDFVSHHAAQIDVRLSVADPLFDARVNILGSLNLLECCRRNKVKKIIFASSGGAMYGDTEVIPTPEDYPAKPCSPYGIAKVTVEHYLYYYKIEFGLPYVCLRYSNVYGPRQNSKGEAGVVAIFADKMLNEVQPVINGAGKQTRDYVYVGDVVRANLLALEKKVEGEFNVATTKETSVNELFAKMVKILNRPFKETHGPAKSGEQKRSCLSYEKIKKILLWQPAVGLDEGLELTIKWFKENI
ncbi:MAG: NAD-dependent epimerase/dehydratase family protein [bacterium]